jgi:hypothetical protein
MNDLDLNDVRTFVSVAQAGTLTAAAKEMACPVLAPNFSLENEATGGKGNMARF